MAQKIRKIVFPVGGLGTRFLPATKAMPKEMLPVVDKPLIHHAFEEAREAGIEQFIFITGRNKNVLNNHFDHSYELQSILSDANKSKELALTKGWLPDPGNIIFIRQQEPLGLGHAVWCARHVIGNEPFAVALADDIVLAKTPCLKQMVDAHPSVAHSHMVAVMDVPREKTNRYGILDIEKEDGLLVKCRGLVEKPAPENAPSTLSIIGRYILQPSVFDHLSKFEKGAGSEIQLTDAIANSIGKTDVYGYRFEGKRYDCGERTGYVEANLAFALADPEMRDRVKAFLKDYI